MEENQAGITEELSAQIESEWSENPGTSSTENQVESQKNTASNTADQPEQLDQSSEQAEHNDVPDEGQEQTTDQPEAELFTLKNRDEVRKVSRDELIAMAQKGWDYDLVRGERDELRAFRTEANPAYELVKTYAQRNGMSVPDYLDYCRKQELIQQGINEQTAQAQVMLEKQQKELSEQQEEMRKSQQRQAEIIAQAKRQEEARKKDLQDFIAAYPGVKPEEVPKEVWAQVANGKSLVTAYTIHRNKVLESEIAAMKKNTENAARTTGSLASPADGKDKVSEIDKWWYADD